MASWLDSLLELQDVDLKIRSLAKRLELIPKERNEFKEQRNDEKTKLAESKNAIQETEVKLKSYEGSMTKHLDTIAKLQQRSAQIRRNEEYLALMKEIDFTKAKISDLETETIVLMDKLDNMKRNFVHKEEECAARIENIDSEITSLTDLEEEVHEMLTKLETIRKERAIKVSEPILEAYSRILSKNQDTPAVKIINGNICGNCRLKLTPQTLSTARSGNLAHCDNCSHIVYFGEVE